MLTPKPIPDYFDFDGNQVYEGDCYKSEICHDSLNPDHANGPVYIGLVCLWNRVYIRYNWVDIGYLDEYIKKPEDWDDADMLEVQFDNDDREYLGNIYRNPEKFTHLINNKNYL